MTDYTLNPRLPAITVLLVVRNAEDTLSEALDSILAQTCPPVAILVVDDASDDRTPAILKCYASETSIVHISRHSTSQGLAASLNECLPLVETPYIARMDADDIALPNRFERQLHFLERHHEIAVCGTWIECFGEIGGIGQRPVEHRAITASLLFFNPVAHPTVMARTGALQRVQYDPAFTRAQDFELWSRMAYDHGLRFHNLPEVLLRYRTSSSNYFLPWHEEVLRRNLFRMGIEPSDNEMALHMALSLGRSTDALREAGLEGVTAWLNTLSAANAANGFVAKEELESLLRSVFLQCLPYVSLAAVFRNVSFVRFVSRSMLMFFFTQIWYILKKIMPSK